MAFVPVWVNTTTGVLHTLDDRGFRVPPGWHSHYKLHIWPLVVLFLVHTCNYAHFTQAGAWHHAHGYQLHATVQLMSDGMKKNELSRFAKWFICILLKRFGIETTLDACQHVDHPTHGCSVLMPLCECSVVIGRTLPAVSWLHHVWVWNCRVDKIPEKTQHSTQTKTV